jgi:hypothetical protein
MVPARHACIVRLLQGKDVASCGQGRYADLDQDDQRAPKLVSGPPLRRAIFLASAENLRRLTKLSVRQGLFVKRLLIGSLADTERPASFIRLKIGFNGSRGLEAPPTGAVKAPVSCCSGLLRTPIL